MAETVNRYWTWIAANQPTDPRGRCAELTKAMAVEFPELRRVRGHYTCPLDGRRCHWWMVDAAGKVIDPTACQFASNGMGDYEEYIGPEPTGHCLDCGELVYHGENFCNAECFKRTVDHINDGGKIFVNAQQVYP